MRVKQQCWGVLVAAMLVGLLSVTAVAATGEQFIPVLSIREGAVRSMMIPRADGYIAYLTLLNERDGGINGIKLVWEECETVYDVKRTVECYERLKAKGPTGAAVFHPMGTPPTYALIERATHDRIPLITLGYGRADAADGRVFPYVFNPPTTYWSQNTAKIRFIGQRADGMDKLKGLKIVHIYHDSEYGRETIPILDTQAAQYGFAVQHLAVPPPGLDQKAIWLRVKVAQPDWVILRGAGVMTPTALKEAAQVGFPRDKIMGNSSTCPEQDVVPAGEAAIGFICASLFDTGRNFPLIQDVLTYVYARGKGPGPESDVGTSYWTRGLMHGVLTTEALRTAMREFGHQPLTGAQVQWALDRLNITAASIKELGAEGLMRPITLSCRDHEGGGSVKFLQWDGTQWNAISDWITTDQALVRPLVEASAAKYAQEKGITPRACP
ncbi:MAG TPA: ABC transporter substrate-binding protein [Candidatus Tectomicrobia bacterium]|nr:ABC transporter substrate-binding protein [Candidatus Tectomicrobia bacterium]